MDKSAWISFIDEIDSGKIRGRKTTAQILKPFLYYYYILNKRKPTMKDGNSDIRYEIDHLVAQKLFKNNPLADETFKDNYLNFSLLPKGTNIAKNDNRLKDINDDWVRDRIKYYADISDDDFETLSDISKVSKLKDIRKGFFVKTYTNLRDSYLANL